MAGISTGVGLISGINIEDLVTKLMAIENRPLDALKSRITDLNNKKTVFASITASLLKLKLDADALTGTSNIFTSRQATSSNQSILTATASKSAPLGNYAFTVKSLVQSHQVVSGGYSGPDSTVGTGTISIEMGNGGVDQATALDSLNGGRGVATGSIVITDRSGQSTLVDLSGAATVQDVLDAVNTAAGISVTASADGDHIVLTDVTGQTASNLKVTEVGKGTTAADLGIKQNVAADTLTGSNVVSIAGGTYLDLLNDKLGVRHAAGLDDFQITRRDGVTIDVSIASAQTVQQALDAINNDAANADGQLTASISADGTGITLADTTGGGGTLSVTALNGSMAAEDLGILGTAAGDTLTGKRVVAGLNTVLLRTLEGGAGMAAGSIHITNRQGVSADVDLAGASTLSDVISAINASGINVTASLNDSGTGLALADASGGSGTLSVAEVDSTTARDLGLLKSVSSDTLRGSNVQRQYVGENTLLATLNGGKGVYKGSFTITNSNGLAATIDLSQSDDVRIEDVISEINASSVSVTASINSTGDGILLTDTAGGSGAFHVTDVDGTTASDLRLAGSAAPGDPTHIDGTYEYRVTVTAGQSIQQIADNISATGAPLDAMIINDGSSTNPYRLALASSVSGSAGKMTVDAGDLGMDFFTTQTAQDAVVLYGQNAPGSSTMKVTRTTNTISGLVPGLTLNLVGTSDQPVNVSVTSDDDSITKSVSTFVDDWNAVVDQLQQATQYTPGSTSDSTTGSTASSTSGTAGPLLGDATAMRIEDMLNSIVSYNAPGASPTLNRLSRVGVTFLETGHISFDQTKLETALGTRRTDVEQLFTAKDTGLGAHASSVIDSYTDGYTGLIKQKDDLYDAQIQVFQEQTDSLTARLAKVQARLYEQFYAMEDALAKLQTQQSAIANWPNYLISSTGQQNKS